MGGFVKNYLNPLSAGPIGDKLMNTPFMQKMNHDDPLVSALGSGAGSWILPASEQSAQLYNSNHPQPAGASTFAGIDPALKDANTGYQGTPSGAAYNPNVNSLGYGLSAATQAQGSNPNQTVANMNKQNTQPLSQQLAWGG